MFIIYNLIGIIITLFSPFIFIYRIVIGKEDINRFTERYCKYNKTNIFSKTIWIHVASVGELMSIVPVLKKLEQNKKIKQILLTSTTTSSANIFLKLKLKKTTHKYFPIDTNFFSQKFIKYWNPSLAIFVESEIWPNMLKNLHIKNPDSSNRGFCVKNYLPYFNTACAADNLAIGTLNGEQDT